MLQVAIGNAVIFNLKTNNKSVPRKQGCSNAKHELVYGQVCLAFISSISFEDEATSLKHTSSMITIKQDYSCAPNWKLSLLLYSNTFLNKIVHVNYYRAE